jgi:hypothetical protein
MRPVHCNIHATIVFQLLQKNTSGGTDVGVVTENRVRNLNNRYILGAQRASAALQEGGKSIAKTTIGNRSILKRKKVRSLNMEATTAHKHAG